MVSLCTRLYQIIPTERNSKAWGTYFGGAHDRRSFADDSQDAMFTLDTKRECNPGKFQKARKKRKEKERDTKSFNYLDARDVVEPVLERMCFWEAASHDTRSERQQFQGRKKHFSLLPACAAIANQ